MKKKAFSSAEWYFFYCAYTYMHIFLQRMICLGNLHQLIFEFNMFSIFVCFHPFSSSFSPLSFFSSLSLYFYIFLFLFLLFPLFYSHVCSYSCFLFIFHYFPQHLLIFSSFAFPFLLYSTKFRFLFFLLIFYYLLFSSLLSQVEIYAGNCEHLIYTL